MSYLSKITSPYHTLVRWYGKKTVMIVAGVLVVLIVAALFVAGMGNGPTTETETPEARLVTVARVDALAASGGTFSVVGSVSSVSEARLQTESGGRVTRVNAGIGDTVAAGRVLAELENSRERAALLQAQGSYEVALAGAQSSDVSLDTALDAARNASRSAFITTDNVMGGTVDGLFTDYNRQVLNFQELSWERRLIGYDLDTWGEKTLTNLSDSEIDTALNEADAIVKRSTAFVDSMIEELARKEGTASGELETLIADTRSTLTGARGQLASAQSAIINAKSGLEQARIAGSGENVSIADAQVKQALGSLRAAEAAYEKTLVRSPIAGVVNAFYLKANDYVGMGAPAAIVANNSALEITTSVSETDRELIAIGDTVAIEGGAKGTITRIAPAIDPTTGKIEVKISVADDSTLDNGDTVSIAFTRNVEAAAESPNEIIVPIVAFKITPDGPVAFSINAEGELEERPVKLGDIRGNMVVVSEGLSNDTEIVTDARGLKAGQKVTTTN